MDQFFQIIIDTPLLGVWGWLAGLAGSGGMRELLGRKHPFEGSVESNQLVETTN